MTATSFDTKNYTSLIAKGLDAIEFTPTTTDEISSIEEALQSIVKPNDNHIVHKNLNGRVEWLRQFKEDYLSWGVTESQKDLFIKLVDNLIQQKIEEVTDLNLLPYHQHYHEQQEKFADNNLKEKKEHDDLTLKKQAEIAKKNENTPLETNIKKLIAKGIIPEADINQAYTLYNLEELDVFKNDQVVDHILAGRICVENACRLLQSNIAKLVESGILTVEDVEKLMITHTLILDNESVATLLQDKKIQLDTILNLSIIHRVDLSSAAIRSDNWVLSRELHLIESNGPWLRGLTTYAVSILCFALFVAITPTTFSLTPTLLDIFIISSILATYTTLPTLSLLHFLERCGTDSKYSQFDLSLFSKTIIASIFVPVICLLSGAFGLAAVIFLIQAVSTAIFASFSWYRVCQADNFANQNTANTDLFRGWQYLRHLKEDWIQARTESLWNSIIYTSAGNYRFDFFHPSLTSRIRKIDQEVMFRVKNIQKSNPELSVEEVLIMLEIDATS